jgi:uncharacterized protein YcaQ
VLEERAGYAAWVLEEVRRRGPLAADDLPPPDGAAGRIPGAWIGTVARGVLEAHFLRGSLAAAGRRPDFSRLYDLAERFGGDPRPGGVAGITSYQLSAISPALVWLKAES